jgi:hypothetical protein
MLAGSFARITTFVPVIVAGRVCSKLRRLQRTA